MLCVCEWADSACPAITRGFRKAWVGLGLASAGAGAVGGFIWRGGVHSLAVCHCYARQRHPAPCPVGSRAEACFSVCQCRWRDRSGGLFRQGRSSVANACTLCRIRRVLTCFTAPLAILIFAKSKSAAVTFCLPGGHRHPVGWCHQRCSHFRRSFGQVGEDHTAGRASFASRCARSRCCRQHGCYPGTLLASGGGLQRVCGGACLRG